MTRFRKAIAAFAASSCILTASVVYASRPGGSTPGGELLLVMVIPAVVYIIMDD